MCRSTSVISLLPGTDFFSNYWITMTVGLSLNRLRVHSSVHPFICLPPFTSPITWYIRLSVYPRLRVLSSESPFTCWLNRLRVRSSVHPFICLLNRLRVRLLGTSVYLCTPMYVHTDSYVNKRHEDIWTFVHTQHARSNDPDRQNPVFGLVVVSVYPHGERTVRWKFCHILLFNSWSSHWSSILVSIHISRSSSVEDPGLNWVTDLHKKGHIRTKLIRK